MVHTQLNSITIDLEDWYHPEYIRKEVKSNLLVPMIEESTSYSLNLFADLNIKTTFFVNGEVATRFPQLIKQIEQNGHEIASHSFSHTPLWKLTPEKFAFEISSSKKAIRSAIGKDPIGFRAASFSLNNETRWALSILSNAGFQYDSSIFPVRTSLYGIRGVPPRPYRPSLFDIRAEDKENKLIEFPPLTTTILGIRVPTSGGFYFRVLPHSVVKHAIIKANQKGYPAMLYFHPWELMKNTPKIRITPHRYFITYLNLSRVEKQIRFLADCFKFAPVKEVLNL